MTDKELVLNHWVHPRTGEHRFYIRNWREVIGLSVDYYRPSYHYTSSFRGLSIRNSRVRRIEMRLWFDTNKQLHIDDFNGGRGVLNIKDVPRYVEEYIEECGGLTLPEPFNNNNNDSRKEPTND